MLRAQFYLFAVAILFSCYFLKPVQAQNIQNDVIGCSGEVSNNSSASIQWTLGECIIESFSNSEYSLTQGFHQNYFKFTPLSNIEAKPLKIIVYPNPTSDFLYVKLPESKKTAFIKILDLNGKLFYENKYYNSETKLNLTNLSLSTYILHVHLDDNISELFKIEKITF